MHATQRSLATAAAALIAVTAIGCSSLAQKDPDPFDKKLKKESSFLDKLPLIGKKKDEEPIPYPNPVKIAATWTPDTLVQTGRTPTRGFGGRVFFYDEKSRPVPVEGTLIVHGFNDAAETPEDRVKRFEFTPEQFTRHFSQTDLGASYSIWIPWDAVGGPQTRISLVTSFKTAEGKPVQGVPATLVLPGLTPQDELGEMKTTKLATQYKEHVEATESGTTRSSGLTTTTIARRRTSVTDPGPGIKIPSTKRDMTVIASQEGTPSFDLGAPKASRQPLVQPASAEMPLRR